MSSRPARRGLGRAIGHGKIRASTPRRQKAKEAEYLPWPQQTLMQVIVQFEMRLSAIEPNM